MAEPRAQILPTYVVIDESESMLGTESELRDGMQYLLEALREYSDAAAVAHVGVLAFSTTAEVRQPLTDWAELAEVPELHLGGLTSYQSAFELLRETIVSDVETLRADSYRVLRPSVFFLSDGMPNIGIWKPAHDALVATEFPYRPNVLAFGVGGADPLTISQVASSADFAFMAEHGVTTGEALVRFFRALTASVIASGSGATAQGTRPMLQVKRPDGFINIDIGELT